MHIAHFVKMQAPALICLSFLPPTLPFLYLYRQRLYRIVINLRDPSFLLPKSSTFHEPPSTDNSLTASVTHLSLTLTNSLDLFDVKQPHIDTTTPLPSYLHATDTSSFLYSHSDTVSQSHVNVSELELHGFQISRYM